MTCTPGQWKARQEYGNRWVIEAHNEGCVPIRIAQVTNTLLEVGAPNLDDIGDNASLMASAPTLAKANVLLLEALQDYVKAQGRMRDKWAEGDEHVKTDLWRALHACEDKARAAIEAATGGGK